MTEANSPCHLLTLAPCHALRSFGRMIGEVLTSSGREVRAMNRQVWVAWSLILLQAAMFWYMSETVLFPIVIVAISLSAVWRRKPWGVSTGYLPGIDLVLAAGCGLRWNLAPYDPPTMMTVVPPYPLVHAAGQFFLLAQVARLWIRRPDRPLPMYLPLLAVLVFMCLGDVQLSRHGRMRRMHQRATLTLVGLSCAYYALARRRQEPSTSSAQWVRPVATAGVLLVCGASAYAGNSFLLERWSELEQMLLRASGPRPLSMRQNLMVGFSGQAPLGSVQLLRSFLDDEIAVRVISEQPPGYLRGAVFERYSSRSWETHADWVPVNRSRRPVADADRIGTSAEIAGPTLSQFVLRESSATKLRPVTIWRSPAMDRFTFLPLGTSRLDAPINTLNFDRHSVVSADNMPPEVSLTAWVPNRPDELRDEPIIQPLDSEEGVARELDRLETMAAKVRLRQLPNRLAEHPTMIEIAEQVFAGCQTPQEKVNAVQRHFATYRYSTDVAVPTTIDPVLYFLRDKPAAHCEFFASATAVLLRMAGVPCRYVTGYAGAEFNAVGNYWVVRQRDAHAWVEAYLPDEGWVIVDTTPAAHAPTTSTGFGLWQLWDEITLRGQMIRTALASEGIAGKWSAIKLFFMSLLTTIPGALISGGLLFLAVRKIRFARKTASSHPLDLTVIELRRLLDELDRRLRRLNLERAAHETLHQFAQRVRVAASSRPNLVEAAEWYLRYAATRYGMSLKAETEELLRADLQAVCARLNERRKVGDASRG